MITIYENQLYVVSLNINIKVICFIIYQNVKIYSLYMKIRIYNQKEIKGSDNIYLKLHIIKHKYFIIKKNNFYIYNIHQIVHMKRIH